MKMLNEQRAVSKLKLETARPRAVPNFGHLRISAKSAVQTPDFELLDL